MATTGYRHGIYTSEQATSILPARTVDSAVVFAVGTAPVHLLAEGTSRPAMTSLSKVWAGMPTISAITACRS